MTPIIENYLSWRHFSVECEDPRNGESQETNLARVGDCWDAAKSLKATTLEDLAAKIVMVLEGQDDLEEDSLMRSTYRDALLALTNEETFQPSDQ